MAMVDKFVILDNVQFEKNGFQNRYNVGDKWVTKSVASGTCDIRDKKYASGRSLLDLNMKWINAIKETLEIDAEIVKTKYGNSDNATQKLIMEISLNKGSIYVTNPDAKDKYLNESSMKAAGIDIEYCVVPRHLCKSTFEIFAEYGIDGAIKQLPKVKECVY